MTNADKALHATPNVVGASAILVATRKSDKKVVHLAVRSRHFYHLCDDQRWYRGSLERIVLTGRWELAGAYV